MRGLGRALSQPASVRPSAAGPGAPAFGTPTLAQHRRGHADDRRLRGRFRLQLLVAPAARLHPALRDSSSPPAGPGRLGYRACGCACLAARDRVQAGEDDHRTLRSGQRLSRLPKLWLEVEEASDLPGHTAQFVTSTGTHGATAPGGCRPPVTSARPVSISGRSRCAAPIRSTSSAASCGSGTGVDWWSIRTGAGTPPLFGAAGQPARRGTLPPPHALRHAQRERHPRVRAGRLGQPDPLEEQPAHRLAEGEDVRARPGLASLGRARSVQLRNTAGQR